MRLFACCLTFGLFAALPALACERYQPIDPVQLKQDFATLNNPEADHVDRIVAFSTLICSEQPAVRKRAIEDGKKATVDIQSAALYYDLASNNAITIRLLDQSGLSEAHYEEIRSAPLKAYEIKFRDPTTSCLSLYQNDQCSGAHHVSVNGSTVQFRYDDQVGVFTLDDTGLTGNVTYVIDRKPLTFPARIELQ